MNYLLIVDILQGCQVRIKFALFIFKKKMLVILEICKSEKHVDRKLSLRYFNYLH